MATLVSLQGGARSGDTTSFLDAGEPDGCDIVSRVGIGDGRTGRESARFRIGGAG